MDWYYVVDNKWNGPHSQDKIAALLRSRKIDGETKVWREGLANWTPLGSVEELRTALESVQPSQSSEDRDTAPMEEHAAPIQPLETSRAKIDNTGLSLPEIIAESFIGENARHPIEAHPPAWDEKVERFFTVSSLRSTGKNWRSIVVFAAVVLGISGSMLLTWLAVQPGKEAREARQREASKAAQHRAQTARLPWRNPVTGRSASLPPGWSYKKEISKRSDLELFNFTSRSKLKTIHVAAHRNIPSAISVHEYETRVANSLNSTIKFVGEWRPVSIGGKTLVRRHGENIKLKTPLTYFMYKSGNTYWHLIAINSDPINRGDPASWPSIAELMNTIS